MRVPDDDEPEIGICPACGEETHYGGPCEVCGFEDYGPCEDYADGDY